MAATLKQILVAPERRAAVVADLQVLLDDEVSSKSGMSGLAIKGSFAVVKKVRAGFVPHAIDAMLPEFAQRLQPYYAKYDPTTDGSLGSYLTANESAVSDILLAVADGRARASRHESVKRTYQKLRPQAKKHVEHALPPLGALIERYAEATDTAAPDTASQDTAAPDTASQDTAAPDTAAPDTEVTP